LSKTFVPLNGGTVSWNAVGVAAYYGLIGPIAEGSLIRKLDVSISTIVVAAGGLWQFGVVLTNGDNINLANFTSGMSLIQRGLNRFAGHGSIVGPTGLIATSRFIVHVGVAVDAGPKYLLCCVRGTHAAFEGCWVCSAEILGVREVTKV